MMTGKEIFLILASYCLGCLTSGYYWVRWRTGQDIRRLGSGSVGARNVGRIVGSPGFMGTFLLDFGKGLLAVEAARYCGASPMAVVAVMIAVIIGHSWPLQLGFQGGKGISTSIGALLAYDSFSVLVLLALFLPVILLIRNFTLSGLFAFALAPLVLFLCGVEHIAVVGASCLAILVLITHRKNIREELARLCFTRSIKHSSGSPHKGA